MSTPAPVSAAEAMDQVLSGLSYLAAEIYARSLPEGEDDPEPRLAAIRDDILPPAR